MLLWAAILSLALAHLVRHREFDSLRRELKSYRPIEASEVARQFEESTTRGGVQVIVEDVRYSRGKDSYKVDFAWSNATTGKTYHSDVHLVSDGFGAYHGQIRNGPFINPLGHKGAFPVVVNTPSPLAK